MEREQSELLGLGLNSSQSVFTFSKSFLEKKVARFEKLGYQLQMGKVEYRVNWFDIKEGKEYELVLPKVRFKRTSKEDEN